MVGVAVTARPSVLSFLSAPWQSGSVDHEQGISKAGNPRGVVMERAIIEPA
ncbi:transposase [Mesorhizobium japonicum MAFF 303099]|uniref:Transposase n=1 Tax=Mesorhizobium japonicum (strain LMG 29417 / CECT 9101 / MAFF 303099) TaxID=266835 RepID=Q989Z9_RHILO|nr:transposase [Mesorhizobium japonicum MAFF 303099]